MSLETSASKKVDTSSSKNTPNTLLYRTPIETLVDLRRIHFNSPASSENIHSFHRLTLSHDDRYVRATATEVTIICPGCRTENVTRSISVEMSCVLLASCDEDRVTIVVDAIGKFYFCQETLK